MEMTAHERRLWEARMEIGLSFLHKAAYVLLACIGFWALQWLGDRQADDEHYRRNQWEATSRVTGVVDDAVTEAAKSATSAPGGAQTLSAKQALKTLAPTSGASATCPTYPDSEAPARFGSREELVAAMQERAEVCVWAKFREMTKAASLKLEDMGRAAPKPDDKDAFSILAEFIGKADTHAFIAARVARQRVAAQLRSLPLKPRKFGLCDERNADETLCNDDPGKYKEAWFSGKMRAASADDNQSHVIYEMLWYAALLLGVLAASILFIVFLTALPMTTAEGYWTKRVGQILERVPIPSKAGLAVPLLAAALGGGTLAGAIAATEPGGEGRDLYFEPRVVVATVPSQEPGTPIAPAPGPQGPQGPQGEPGASFFYPPVLYGTEWTILPPPASGSSTVDLTRIESALGSIGVSARGLVRETQAANRIVEKASEAMASQLAGVKQAAEEASRCAAGLQQSVALIEASLKESGTSVVGLKETVGQMATTLATRQGEIAVMARAIQGLEDDRAKVSALALGQTSQLDQRNLFARSFRSTLYQVGPLVPSVMKGRLIDRATEDEAKKVSDVLRAMRSEEPPLTREKFEEAFETRLGKAGLAPGRVEDLVSENMPSLRKVCALPRQ
jgi:hypothetical protein